jgi:hypothetical protein
MTAARRARRGMLAGIAALAAACMTSGDPRAYPQATSAFGAEVTVSLVGGGGVQGELLAVTDTSVLLMVRDRVVVARGAAIIIIAAGRTWFSYANGGPRIASLERLRRLSRFPYGIAPATMAALLAKSAQSAPDDASAVR